LDKELRDLGIRMTEYLQFLNYDDFKSAIRNPKSEIEGCSVLETDGEKACVRNLDT
jgi:hypothetical protein